MLDRSGRYTPPLPALPLALRQHITPHTVAVRRNVQTDRFVRVQIVTSTRYRASCLVWPQQLVYRERACQRHRSDLQCRPNQLA